MKLVLLVSLLFFSRHSFAGPKAAEILELDGFKTVDAGIVRSAARARLSKLPSDGDEDERQKILRARDALLNYFRNYSGRYSWHELFREADEALHTAIRQPNPWFSMVWNGRDENSLRDTEFEFLYQYSKLEQAYLPFEGHGRGTAEVSDMILVVAPALFPRVQIKYLSRLKDEDGSRRLIKTATAVYIRNRHSGTDNVVADALVLPDGNYLINPLSKHTLEEERSHPALKVTAMDILGKRWMISSRLSFVFTEMHPDGTEVGTTYTSVRGGPYTVMSPKLPKVETRESNDWKFVELPSKPNVLVLPFQRVSLECEQMFR